jgi:ATP-dependent DNA helicase RecG
MDITKILEIIDKIKKGTPAKNFEDIHFDVKRYPANSQDEKQKKKLASLLKEYSVAFANSEGGTLLLGIEDDIAGAKAITGCKNYDIEEMRRMVFDGTRPPIIIEIEEIALPEGIVLAVNVPKSPRIHSASSGVKHKRIGKENRILYPEDETSLKVEKGYDYTAGYLFDVGIDSLDPLEISRLKNWIEKYNPKSEILELKDVDLLKSLGIIREIEGTDRPTIAGLFLLGKEQVLKKFLPQNEIIYFRFEKSDVDPVQSAYMKMPLLKTIEKIWSLIEPYNQVHTIKDAFLETPVPSFPEDVVREALLNAVVHRDYTLPDSIHVRVFSDRIEISNPGSFIGGVTLSLQMKHYLL